MERCLAVAILCAAAPALADRAAADRLSGEAETLAAKGELAAAAQKFRAAFAEDPRPELICNVGVAYYKALDLPLAQRYLAQCKELSARLDPTFVANVDQVLAAVEQQLRQGNFTPVQLVVEPPGAETTIAGSAFDEPFVGSRVAWLPFGTYSVVIHADGYVDHEQQVAATDHTPITITARLEHTPTAAPRPPHLPTQSSAPPHEAPRHSYAAPIAVTAATGVVAIATIVSYTTALGHASNANDLAKASYRPPYDAEASSAHTWQHVSWVTGGVAVAGAAASAYLWWRATRAPHVGIEASADHVGLSYSGAW